jgi:signal transduction histidine kinase/DNA-binding response OmpR family regulator
MTETSVGTPERLAGRISATYVAVAVLWIVGSDRLAAVLSAAPDAVAPLLPGALSPTRADDARLASLSALQTAKGIAFVLLTGLALYLLIARGMRRARRAEEHVRLAREAESARYRELVARTADESVRTRDVQQRLQEQLRQSQKMEAVGLLAGGVAHDFNNILVAISGYAELAAAHVAHDSPAREELDGIRQAVERGAGLARQLLALSRRQVQEPTPLDLNAVLTDLGRMLPRVLGRGIELSLRTEAQPATVLADLSQVEQLVLNLCVNARDAMPAGGRLMLQTETLRLPAGEDGVGGGRRVALVVTDTGTGMDTATRERIFEPFFSTKPAGRGTGLGLSTVYAIVQQSGGSIACTSAPGHGTTFRIEFPLVSAEEGGDGSVPDVLAHGTETVLLVLDDACARETAERALARHGYSVLATADMDSAERLAEQHGAPVHVLVAAGALAGRDGPALEHLRARHPGLAVLLVSGREPLPAMHGVSLLAAPFTPLELAASVRRALVRHDSGDDGPAAGSTARPPAIARASTGLTVLIADDDAQVCHVVREMLESAGHAVILAANGAEALDLLRSRPVDVVLCDMLMPEKEGIETCSEMHRRHPGLPFIAMSGAPGGSSYMRIAVKLGAAGSLAKPFSRQDLLLALDRALAVRDIW